jgi:hypothetical protein
LAVPLSILPPQVKKTQFKSFKWFNYPSLYPVPSTVTVPAPAASASQQSSSEQTTFVSQLREAYFNCLLNQLPTKLLLKATCKQSSVFSQPSPIIWTTLSTALSTLTATHPSFVKHL